MKWTSFWEKIGNWELWPFELRYLLITPVWLWYCLRSGSFWFFTPSNPTITFGGFEGEGKKEMYDQLPLPTYPLTVFIQPGTNIEEVKQQVLSAGLRYPFIVKPDVGMKGLLFRKIDNESMFETYHRMMPVEYMAQELVTYPVEVSVFYYRFPWQEQGCISGFIKKDLMEITGDGKSTVKELILMHPKAKYRLEEMWNKHADQLEKLLPAGEKFFLAYAANLNRGASFTNLENLVDDKLLKVFDDISVPAQFYYGRYDIKCASVEALKSGKDFSILEYNGCGAEPNHIYHRGLGLFQAQKIILQHWNALFRISRYNHKKGIHHWPHKKGLAFLKKAKQHLRLLESLEKKIPL